MFKKIQKYLLINQPLLWNLKIVPITFYMIFIHIVIYVLGYINGAINFSETVDNYDYNSDQDTILVLGGFLSLIVFIVWAIFYFKNNALKSFYPKTKFSLFKEWCLILFISMLLTTFPISFFYGKDTRVRSYFTETEARKRCEILSEGSMFVEGSFSEHYDSQDNNQTNGMVVTTTALPNEKKIDSTVVTTDTVKIKDYFYYKGEMYSNYSLLNKNINSYSFFDYKNDSLRKRKLKDWMVTNQKDSVKFLFKKYLAIAKEHHLKASIDEDKWLKLVFNYPNFTYYKVIGGEEKSEFFDINNESVVNAIDTTSQYLVRKFDRDYLVNRFYVPEKALNYSYEKIANSWNNPTVSLEVFLLSLYFAFGLSFVVFSFRVTSGRNWLIALVVTGIINIVIGIIAAFNASVNFYFGFQLLFFIVLLSYFLIVLYRKKAKGFTGISNTILLWMLTPFLPVTYGLIFELIKETSGYNYCDYNYKSKFFPRIDYLNDSDVIVFLLYINLVLVILMMLFLTLKIKKWRGVAES
ncbi:hypothetical protein OX283_003810 [Flavobacterium sp. SUN052]|uniref:hypothetical protein n=1 Tax=Flavobacterium sp. SUN052 TaxID=3002441 RepID=UPI00237D68EB|nr:hypothetical protein [Flavobacterium sp. SUN052]MEC4003770.1 hypothetical protein [Flavobacterium sp. SUN052]